MTPAKLVGQVKDLLKEAGCPDAETDAFFLYEHVFETDRMQYLLGRMEPFAEDAKTRHRIAEYRRLAGLRAGGEPLQYLLGTAWFMGLPFAVSPAVLIPRADTEILVETALELLQEGESLLDLCTGSGCIILSLARLGKPGRAVGSDISAEALAVARTNRERLDLQEVDLVESDLFDHISGRYDMIVSNPPYIPSGQIGGLMREVAGHEPHRALDGGLDGLDFYREIARLSPDYLLPGGRLILEIGCDQGAAVAGLLEEAGFSGIGIRQDLAGLDRVVSGTWPA